MPASKTALLKLLEQDVTFLEIMGHQTIALGILLLEGRNGAVRGSRYHRQAGAVLSAGGIQIPGHPRNARGQPKANPAPDRRERIEIRDDLRFLSREPRRNPQIGDGSGRRESNPRIQLGKDFDALRFQYVINFWLRFGTAFVECNRAAKPAGQRPFNSSHLALPSQLPLDADL